MVSEHDETWCTHDNLWTYRIKDIDQLSITDLESVMRKYPDDGEYYLTKNLNMYTCLYKTRGASVV